MEISNATQLGVLYCDPDGNGLVFPACNPTYSAAFPHFLASGLGCPSTGCIGYELTADITLTASSATPPHNIAPIGSFNVINFSGIFEGNNHTISGLQVNYSDHAGLFSTIASGGIVRNLGIINPSVTTTGSSRGAGGLAGTMSGGQIINSYVSGGTVTAASNFGGAGGLVGVMTGGSITASYTTATVATSGTRSIIRVGGMVGNMTGGSITASYAAGPASGTASSLLIGGLTGSQSSGTITNSYCDTQATGQTCGGHGRTTSQLQTPTGYTGPYAAWNLNISGDASLDNPWFFGTSSQYPTLSWQRSSTAADVDYDSDDDGLIEVNTLYQLHALRWDLNGNGDADATANDDDYEAAFPWHDESSTGRMGCPSGSCTGYELTGDLAFETGLPYASWTPIGGALTPYSATFDGNGHTISGLTISTTSGTTGLFSTLNSNRVIRNVGLISPSVASTASSVSVGALVGFANAGSVIETSYVQGGTVTLGAASIRLGGLVGASSGTIRASWSTATLQSTSPCTGCNSTLAGGLVGRVNGGHITASYAAGANSVAAGTGSVLGGLVGRVQGAGVMITNSYCDSTVRVVADCVGGRVSGVSVSDTTAPGHSTSDLQTPTDYTGIYHNWNIDTDGDDIPDNPWYFGGSSDYPVPSYRRDSTLPDVDYDTDDDGLIDITNPAQLNAVRWDLNGNGDADATSNDDYYEAAFPWHADAAMGCPTMGGCTGYELAGDLTLTGSWTPIGSVLNGYDATFDGQSHTISGLTISTTAGPTGLFGALGENRVIRNVGLLSPSVASTASNVGIGALVGYMSNGSTIETSYVAGGAVTLGAASAQLGGLVGDTAGGTIRASYSTATLQSTSPCAGCDNTLAGGLVGRLNSTAIVASYAAGANSVTAGTGSELGGLVGRAQGAGVMITDSYCDSTVMVVAGCVGGRASGVSASDTAAPGHPTTDLQTPTDYTGIYTHWNLDLDANNVPDYLWNFRTNSQYPILNTPAQRTAATPAAMDYDADDDGLIDISTAAQLNAVRWDANGDGDPDAADAHAYSTAFAGRTHTADATTGRMGCPVAGGCTGYELLSSLTLTGQWTPMDFSATFNGQGYTISGLTVSSSADSANAGLFGLLSTANGVIRNLGVTSPSVTTSGTAQNSGGLVGRIGTGANVETSYVSGGSVTASGSNNRAGGLAGLNQGRIRASYATAAVTHSGNPIGVHLGGLAGYSSSAEIVASYAAGAVTASTGLGSEAGGLVGRSDGAGDTITDSYCDSTVMLVTACIGALAGSPASTATAAAHSTSDLQSPTGYTAGSLYANWNLDLDGQPGGDNPWDFGTSSNYPTLRLPTNRPTVQPIVPPGGNGNGGSGNGGGNGGSSPQPVARGGGQPYNPAHAHPEIYANPRHEMSVSCEVRTTGEGDQAVTTSTLTFDLGAYTRPITLVLSLWDGQFFRTLQSQNLPMPELRQEGQTATVEVVTDPAQTRFRIDSEYGLNLVLGYADCRTDDP